MVVVHLYLCLFDFYILPFPTVLSFLLHSGAYSDALILHERSAKDHEFPWDPYKDNNDNKDATPLDRRKDLHDTWLVWCKFQPLRKVRDYFGEKIGLYFAWLGMYVLILVVSESVPGIILYNYCLYAPTS